MCEINWDDYMPSTEGCTPCGCCIALIKLGKHLQSELDKAKGLLEKCVEPMLRYKSCLKGYAKESAHKGKRDNQKFWEQRTKKVAILQQEIEQALESEVK